MDLISNCSHGSDSQNPEIQELKFITYIIIAPIIVLFGVVLNLWGLCALRKSTIRGVTHLYLNALGVSNCLVVIFLIPSIIHISAWSDCESFSEAFYHAIFETNLINITMTFSTYVLGCVVVERYFCVCQPAKFYKIHQKKVARSAIIISFLAAAILRLPSFFQWTPIAVNNGTSWIVSENTDFTGTVYWKIYVWTSEIMVRFGPGCLLAVLNILLIVRFVKVVERRQKLSTFSADSDFSEDEKRFLVVLCMMVVLFVIATFPAGLLSVMNHERFYDLYSFEVFRSAANMAEIFYFAVNFFLCCLSSVEIRKQLKNICNF